MTIADFSWAVMAASLVAMVLNIRKHRACFYIWACTNLAWMVVDLWHGIWAQGILFGVYFAASVWGIFAWRKRKAI